MAKKKTFKKPDSTRTHWCQRLTTNGNLWTWYKNGHITVISGDGDEQYVRSQHSFSWATFTSIIRQHEGHNSCRGYPYGWAGANFTQRCEVFQSKKMGISNESKSDKLYDLLLEEF